MRNAIQDFDLDLTGLTVYTEAATGPYLYTPVLAAISGAQKVYAYTEDSRFGSKENVKNSTVDAAKNHNVDDEIQIVFDKRKGDIEKSDIVTNSGFVRPISSEMVSWMTPTTVVPLMYESWEFRDDDINLESCLNNDILVMGIDEGKAPLSMYRYGGFLGLKLLFDLRLEGYKTNVLLVGGGAGFGKSIYAMYEDIGIETTWFANQESNACNYDSLRNHYQECGSDYDALIIAEHKEDQLIIGENGLLTGRTIKKVNPSLRVGIIAGEVDVDDLESAGLSYYPDNLRSHGYQSYQPSELGIRPPLELYTAGLKVGATMSRHRMDGKSVAETSRITEQETLAEPLMGTPFRRS
jgi:hypothetical protein